jgi:hypothetical protein
MPASQTCEACGGTFGCGAADGVCWCDEMTVDPRVLAVLREDFLGCLCSGCLRARAAAARDAAATPSA